MTTGTLIFIVYGIIGLLLIVPFAVLLHEHDSAPALDGFCGLLAGLTWPLVILGYVGYLISVGIGTLAKRLCEWA